MKQQELNERALRFISAYGQRFALGTTAPKAALLGTRRGLSWVPNNGDTISFSSTIGVLDYNNKSNQGQVALVAEYCNQLRLVTIASLCRLCDDTRKELGRLSPGSITYSLLERGVNDFQRAEMLAGKTFSLKVFSVEKTEKAFNEKGLLEVVLDNEGNPKKYQATIIWLDKQVPDKPSGDGEGEIPGATDESQE